MARSLITSNDDLPLFMLTRESVNRIGIIMFHMKLKSQKRGSGVEKKGGSGVEKSDCTQYKLNYLLGNI